MKDRLAGEVQVAKWRLLEEDKTHAPEDNRTIIALLDSLPDGDLEGYLALVERHMKYACDLVLYTGLALFNKKEQLRLLEQDQELMDKFKKKGIDPTLIATISPQAMFCRKDIYNPTKSSFGLMPITEPQVPGIGISFARWAGAKQTGSDKDYSYYNVYYDAVFARFVNPATAIINGDQKGLTVTSWEVFDNALERAFKSPCRYICPSSSWKFKGGK